MKFIEKVRTINAFKCSGNPDEMENNIYNLGHDKNGWRYSYRLTVSCNQTLSWVIGTFTDGVFVDSVEVEILSGAWYVIRNDDGSLSKMDADTFESKYTKLKETKGKDSWLDSELVAMIMLRLVDTIGKSLKDKYAETATDIMDTIVEGLEKSIEQE